MQIANQVAESSTILLCQLVFFGGQMRSALIYRAKKFCKSKTEVLKSSEIIMISLFIMILTPILQIIYS